MTQPGRLVDFPALARRLLTVAAVLGVLCLSGAIVQGLVAGLTFAVLGRWGGLFLAGMLLAAAAVAAAHALAGAGRARRKGERLAGGDVGLLPTRGGDDPDSP